MNRVLGDLSPSLSPLFFEKQGKNLPFVRVIRKKSSRATKLEGLRRRRRENSKVSLLSFLKSDGSSVRFSSSRWRRFDARNRLPLAPYVHPATTSQSGRPSVVAGSGERGFPRCDINPSRNPRFEGARQEQYYFSSAENHRGRFALPRATTVPHPLDK